MKTYIAIIIILLVIVLLFIGIIKSKNSSESKLSIFEHPSTFEKPDIEMTGKSSKIKENTGNHYKIN